MFYFLYLALTVAGSMQTPAAVGVLYVIFSSLIDVPHLLHTFSRTHLDATEFKRHKRIHRDLLPLSLLLALGSTYLFKNHHLFYKLVDIYGIWHVMKQNWGFIRVYKRVNEDRSSMSNFMDALLFYPSTIAYCLSAAEVDWQFPIRSIPVALFFLYLFYQLYLWKFKGKVNGPKLLFICSVFPVMAMINIYLELPPQMGMIMNSAYHGLQYYGWNMHFQRVRLRFDKGQVKSWNFLCIICGTIITALTLSGGKFELVFTTFILYHYVTDGMIWKFGKQPELGVLLKRTVSTTFN